MPAAQQLCQIADLAKNVFMGDCLDGSRGSRWRAQLAGGSGGARGGRAAPRLEPRARCRGAHESHGVT
jgi:hypothetical protein